MLTRPELDVRLDELVAGSISFEPPAELYHYTSWEGATGILRSRKFWCSRHDHMNDPAELETASSVIVEIASALASRARTDTAKAAFDVFLESYDQLKVKEFVPVYIASFSAARDHAGQWERYGDKGVGVCLGLRLLEEEPPTNAGVGLSLMKVDYSESAWRENVTAALEAVAELLDTASRDNESVALGTTAILRIAALQELRSKHSEWSPEQETRIAVLQRAAADPKWAPLETKTRLRDGSAIEYLEVFVRQPHLLLSLSEVMVGPAQDCREGRRRLVELLKDVGYDASDPAYPGVVCSREDRDAAPE